MYRFFCLTGEPQDECVRCNKVFLASVQLVKHGLCGDCLEGGSPVGDGEAEERFGLRWVSLLVDSPYSAVH
jgi:hypothetical protein